MFFVTRVKGGEVVQLYGYDPARVMVLIQNVGKVDCYLSYWREEFDARSIWLPAQSGVYLRREDGDQVWAPMYIKCDSDAEIRWAYTTVSRE